MKVSVPKIIIIEKKPYTNSEIHQIETPLKSLNVYNSQLLLLIENIPMNQQIVLCPRHCANEIYSKENNFTRYSSSINLFLLGESLLHYSYLLP